MLEQDKQQVMEAEQNKAASNIKLALVLGLVSVAIYLVYIFWHFL